MGLFGDGEEPRLGRSYGEPQASPVKPGSGDCPGGEAGSSWVGTGSYKCSGFSLAEL